jgi:hypothetical protein
MYDLLVAGECQDTGQSTLSGRLGDSWSAHTGGNPCVQDGVTGWLARNYLSTGKMSFNTRISYDTRANSVFTTDGSASGLGHTQCLTRGLQLSAKTSFNASLEVFQQTQERNFGSGPAQGFDNTLIRVANLPLGASWLPSRNSQHNCSLTLNDRNQSRSASQPITLLPYSAYDGSCSAQFVLQ